jgi:hypothetical protein
VENLEERLNEIVVRKDKRDVFINDLLREGPEAKERILLRIKLGILRGPRDERRHFPMLREKIIKKALEVGDAFILGPIFKNFIIEPEFPQEWREMVFDFAGHSREKAFGLARAIIDVASYRSDYYNEPFHSKHNIKEFQDFAAFLVLLPIYAMLGGPGAKRKEWLHRIIEAGQEGSSEACQLLVGTLDFVIRHARDFDLIDYSEEIKNYSQEELWLLINNMLQSKEGIEVISWYIPNNLMPWLVKFINDLFNRDGEKIKIFERDLDWWKENKERLIALTLKKVEGLKTNRHYGLRSGGLDWIKVDINLLKIHGIDKIVFIQEGYSSPDLGFLISVKICGQPKVIKASFIDFKLRIEKIGFPSYDEILTDMLAAVIINGLYSILVGESEETDLPGSSNYSLRQIKSAGDNTTVRPHLRRLPDGWKASAEAKEVALSIFGELPPDKTFVREYEKQASLEPKGETNPVFTFTLENLL